MKWHACMSRVAVVVVVVVVVVAVTTIKTTRNIMTLTGCQQPPPLPLPPHIPSCSSRHFAPPKLIIFIPPTLPPPPPPYVTTISAKTFATTCECVAQALQASQTSAHMLLASVRFRALFCGRVLSARDAALAPAPEAIRI